MKRPVAKIIGSCWACASLLFACASAGFAGKGIPFAPRKPYGTVQVGPNKWTSWQRIPTDISDKIEASNKLLQEGKLADAETMVRALLAAREKEVPPDDLELCILLRGLGTACWAQGKTQDAITAMKRGVEIQTASKIGPTEDLAYDLRVLGQSYQEEGKLVEAQETLALGLYTLDQVEKNQSEPIKLRLELLYWLARTMQQDGRWAKAEPLLERLYRLQTQQQESLKITETAKAETLMRLALGKSMLGEHKGAQEALQNAIELSIKQRRQEAQQP